MLKKQTAPTATVRATSTSALASTHSHSDFSTTRGRLATAFFWLDLGAALIPLQPDSKFMVAGFGPYRAHVLTAFEARKWFGARACNLGVVCAGALVCIDFDSPISYTLWRESKQGIGLITRIEQTWRGVHVYLFVDQLPARGTRIDYPDTELKMLGAAVTAAPSTVYGAPYTVLCDTAPARVENLSKFFPLLSPTPKPNAPAPLPTAPNLRATGNTPVAIAKARLNILAIAREMVMGLHSSDRGAGRWYAGRCPFHEDLSPSFWIDTQRGLWGCHSPNCQHHRGGDAINLEALRRGLSVGEVVRQLRE